MDKKQTERMKNDLSGANLSRADLSRADLSRADLRWADLSGADLDFAAFPLWCGSLGAIVDENIIYQLLYHVLRLCQNNKDLPKEIKDRVFEFKDLANKFHRACECGFIK